MPSVPRFEKKPEAKKAAPSFEDVCKAKLADGDSVVASSETVTSSDGTKYKLASDGSAKRARVDCTPRDEKGEPVKKYKSVRDFFDVAKEGGEKLESGSVKRCVTDKGRRFTLEADGTFREGNLQ